MIAKDSTGTPISQGQWDALLAERDAQLTLLAALAVIENPAAQRIFAGSIVLSNTAIKIREALAGKDAK